MIPIGTLCLVIGSARGREEFIGQMTTIIRHERFKFSDYLTDLKWSKNPKAEVYAAERHLMPIYPTREDETAKVSETLPCE